MPSELTETQPELIIWDDLINQMKPSQHARHMKLIREWWDSIQSKQRESD